MLRNPRSPLSHDLSNLGGFVVKEPKVAVISAILEDLC